MHKATMRWIEQAEERQFVTQAMFERTSSPPWARARKAVAGQWLPRFGAWLAARHPIGWETPQPHPVLVRQPARRRFR